MIVAALGPAAAWHAVISADIPSGAGAPLITRYSTLSEARRIVPPSSTDADLQDVPELPE